VSLIGTKLDCGIHHRKDIFGWHVGHNGVDRGQHIAAILPENLDDTSYFRAYFLWRAKRQDAVRINCATENNIFAELFFSSSRFDILPAEVWIGLRISTPISMKSGMRRKTSPSVWKKQFRFRARFNE